MMNRQKLKSVIEISLCNRCASTFYHSPVHRIKRVDPIEVIKSDCDCCRTGKGFDYYIKTRVQL